MKYIWLFITSFFWIPIALCHAETNAGAIKDAEFVIEKQKKNKVNQEQRLFFKAPTQTSKGLNRPLESVKGLMSEGMSFHPEPEIYLPFSLEKEKSNLFFNHYCRLGIGSLLLPYIEIALDKCPFGKAIWLANLAFIPELWNKKSRATSLFLQGRYGLGSWRLQPSLHYQHNWYRYSDTVDRTCGIHHGNMSLSAQYATPSSTQDGQISLSLLKYHGKKIKEQLLTLQYKWVKQLDNWSLKIASYDDIAAYTNGANQQTRFIFSLTPSLYVRLFKSMQLNAGLRMAYHNDPVPGTIPNFDLYPMAKVGFLLAPWFAPYIGIKGMGVGGGVVPVHLYDIVAKNPFIAFNWKLSYAHQYFNLYGGTKGMISSHFSYHLRIAYRQLKNQYKVVSVSGDQVKLAYHSGDTYVLKSTGLVDYRIPNTTFSTTLKGSYYRYFDDASQPIWWYHKPLYRFKQIFAYKPHAKVLLKGNLHLYGPTVVKDITGAAVERGRIIHLSLGIDYSISKRFTAFLMVNNLLNRKHISYTGYPDKKINLTGGLQYRW